MSLESFPLCCQGAVDQCSALKQCVEILNQRTLVVVPPQAKLLVVLHFLNCFVSSFLHRWRKQAKLAINESSRRTNENRKDIQSEKWGCSLSCSLRLCYRSTNGPDAISSSRDRLLSRTSSRTTYPRKYAFRLSFRLDNPVLPSPVLSPFSHAALAGGRQRRKLRNEAPKLPKWPCAMQARRSDRSSGLCACLVTVTDCHLVGMMQEDAQAPRTRSCDVRAARTTCATTAEAPGTQGRLLLARLDALLSRSSEKFFIRETKMSRTRMHRRS